MNNHEKYFGSPEKAAQSLAGVNDLNEAFNKWADNEGALLCTITPTRGARKKQKQAEVFAIWLQEECND